MPLALCVSMESQYAFCIPSGKQGRKVTLQNEGPGLECLLLLIMLTFHFMFSGLRIFLQLVEPVAYMMPPCGVSIAACADRGISPHMDITSPVAPSCGGGDVTFQVRPCGCSVYSQTFNEVGELMRIVAGGQYIME